MALALATSFLPGIDCGADVTKKAAKKRSKMKNYRSLTTIFLAFLLVSSLSLLSACTDSRPSPGAGSSPTPSPNASAAAERPQQYTSPRGTAALSLNGKKISVDYGRPSMHGRKIFGALVPYDQVWRTGANEATHFTTEADLMLGNIAVPKGTYTLYTLPAPQGWKLIVNRQTGQWGTPYKPEYEKTELARIDMQVESLPSAVEQFTISLAPNDAGGVLNLEWEQTRASLKFTEKK